MGLWTRKTNDLVISEHWQRIISDNGLPVNLKNILKVSVNAGLDDSLTRSPVILPVVLKDVYHVDPRLTAKVGLPCMVKFILELG